MEESEGEEQEEGAQCAEEEEEKQDYDLTFHLICPKCNDTKVHLLYLNIKITKEEHAN